MTSPQTQARNDVAALLREAFPGIDVFPYWPGKARPPFIGLGSSPTDSYVEFEGTHFGGRRIHIAATFVVDAASNDLQADAADEAIDQIINAINESDNFAATSAQAGPVPVNNQMYFGASVSIMTEV